MGKASRWAGASRLTRPGIRRELRLVPQSSDIAPSKDPLLLVLQWGPSLSAKHSRLAESVQLNEK
jgi:hypothetical protein